MKMSDLELIFISLLTLYLNFFNQNGSRKRKYLVVKISNLTFSCCGYFLFKNQAVLWLLYLVIENLKK